MQVTIGRGNNRKSVVLPAGSEMKRMSKENPIEYVKIRGNLMALVRSQQGN